METNEAPYSGAPSTLLHLGRAASMPFDSAYMRRTPLDAIPRSRPPSYPTTCGEPSENGTFVGGSDGSGRPTAALGLSTRDARHRLLEAIHTKGEAKAADHRRAQHAMRDERDPFSALLLICALFCLVEAACLESRVSAEGIVLAIIALSNMMLHIVKRTRRQDEMAERVQAAIRRMMRGEAGAMDDSDEALNPVVLLPSSSLIACYRDAQWQRIPVNLLVEGDVVALMSGDSAPGDVQVLDGSESTYRRGTKIPPSGPSLETTRCNATFNPALLLSLCGDMRVFKMLETPVLADLDDAFFRIKRPSTFTQKLQVATQLVTLDLCAFFSVTLVGAIISRLHFERTRTISSVLHELLQGPIELWIVFASLNLPILSLLAEATSTTLLLSSLSTAIPTTALDSEHEVGIADGFDSEERAHLRSGSKRSSIWRSLEVFGIVLKCRLVACVTRHRSRVSVPFKEFRLLERLGSVTMLCCLDDDVLCDPVPLVEEVFLLNEKQGSSTVLDLHPDRDGVRSLKFEDPKWRQYLPSLKPIGLGILLNDAADPSAYYHAALRYLQSECNGASNDTNAVSDIRVPGLHECLQSLSAHIRLLPLPKHLLQLSTAIGFVREDVSAFRRLQALHTICPRIAHQEHTSDHHEQGHEDTRYRGNLKTHLYSSVVLDQRSNRLQLLSRGHPTIALAQCSEYWDGKSICPLTNETRRRILDMYQQWRIEDLDGVALSYVPIPHRVGSLFARPDRLSDGLLAPIYLVEDSSSGEAIARDPMDELGSSRSRIYSQPTYSPLPSPRSSAPAARVMSPSAFKRRSISALALSDLASSVGIHASELEAAEKEALLWQIQEDQIFLGMAATAVQPRAGTPDAIEDLTAAGVRFVYFSPRNMRRSKLLAEKMGIETDWNCAISLRALDSDAPDPHRMTSNYSDWDVKARLPHGVAAIKRHIQEVDNVPLLVSLYTDSTPETIDEMIAVFQENEEVVLGVGAALKAGNARLFAKADVAVAVETGLPPFDMPIPRGDNLPVFSEDDMELSKLLNTLGCGVSIGAAADVPTSSLGQLIELIRISRALLANLHQMIAFCAATQWMLGTLVLAGYMLPTLPSTDVARVSLPSLMWLMWALVPALALCILASPEDRDVVSRTPRKNEDIRMAKEAPRLLFYFACRHLPSVAVALLVHEWVLGLSLLFSADADAHATSQVVDVATRPCRLFECIHRSSSAYASSSASAQAAAAARAEGAMLLVVGLALLASSASFLYRCGSMWSMPPIRNRPWRWTAMALTVAHVLVCAWTAGLQGADGRSLRAFLAHAAPWELCAVVLLWPIAVAIVDEAVKRHDRRQLMRFHKFLRMQFDTRLGMWSPK